VADPIVYGFPRSTYVNIVRLVLTHKDVPYEFHDLEQVMGKAEHLALHPFNRVPILRHGDFMVYETSAIASYVDEAFEGPRLTPQDVRARARMNQWLSAVNSYYYPYMIYHVTHERLVFPELGIASDRKSGRTCAAQGRSRAWRHGARTVTWRRLPAWVRAYISRLLPPAEYFCLQPHGGRQSHVSEIPCILPVAGADGKFADDPETACDSAATRAHTARARVGNYTPPQVLTQLASSRLQS
jgi:glutathione S-transferase